MPTQYHYISVDFTYVGKDDILYLIEVESDNKAKIDVGEYVLINLLYDKPNKNNGSHKILGDRKIEECRFLTVVCHKSNTPERVTKVLNAVQKHFSLKLKHQAIKLSDIIDVNSFEALLQAN